MARHEGKIESDGSTALDIDELLLLLGREPAPGSDQRRGAIACLLAGGEGWRDARAQAGGAFAEGEPGLIGRKGE